MLRFASTRRSRHAAAGFTLMELMVVVALISVLAGMGVVMYRNSVLRTKEAVLHEDLFRMRDAIDQ
jgi:general secretion pathway protein G